MKTQKRNLTGGHGLGCIVLAWMVGASGCVPAGSTAGGATSGAEAAVATGLDVGAVTPVTWVDVATPQDRKPVSLSFQEGYRASGFAGCNGYAGQVDLGAQAVSFKAIATTRMLCEPEAMDTEQRYLKALEATRSARMDKGVLELLDDQRKVLWRFKPLV